MTGDGARLQRLMESMIHDIVSTREGMLAVNEGENLGLVPRWWWPNWYLRFRVLNAWADKIEAKGNP